MLGRTIALACAFLFVAASVRAGEYDPELVQAPEITVPDAASISGTMAAVSFDGSDVSSGGVTVPFPAELPSSRGAPLFPFTPQYRIGNGLTEWGLGWRARLSIVRSPLVGDVDYQADEYASPWGRLVRGSSGYWYIQNLQHGIRLSFDPELNEWRAVDLRGREFVFDYRVDTEYGTYAWYLSDVTDPVGAGTSFAYVRPDGYMPALQAVTYGNAGHTADHRVEFEYMASSDGPAHASYASGVQLNTPQPVSAMRCLTVSVDTESYVERWKYEFFYDIGDSPAEVFLVGMQRAFASGDTEPAINLGYNTSAEYLSTASSKTILSEVTDLIGASVILPSNSTVADIDHDGRPDIEDGFGYNVYRNTDEGWVFEDEPPVPAGRDFRCRPRNRSEERPRHLVRVVPEDELRVIAMDPYVFGGVYRTEILLCSRDGRVLLDQTLVGDWTLSQTTRLVDINRDSKPDLVRKLNNDLYVAINEFSVVGEEEYAGGFRTELAFVDDLGTVDSLWIQDINGDSVSDLVVKRAIGGALRVAYGRGQLEFEPWTEMDFFTPGRGYLPSIAGYAVSFVDANRDGLSDVVLSVRSSKKAMLFLNCGTYFLKRDVPALLDPSRTHPVVAHLSGGGEPELVTAVSSSPSSGYLDVVLALPLSEPGTSLLKYIDDGKGSAVSFSYGRGSAFAGNERRRVVVTSVTHHVTGGGAVQSAYEFSNPRLHSTARFLLGYEDVTVSRKNLTETTRYYHGDDAQGMRLWRVRNDELRLPGFAAFEGSTYADAVYDGVVLKRATVEKNGLAESTEEAVALLRLGVGDELEENEGIERPYSEKLYGEHAQGRCAKSWTKGSSDDTISMTVESYASIPGIDDTWHCTPARVRMTGTHANQGLDFEYVYRYEYSDAGRVRRVYQEEGLGAQQSNLGDVLLQVVEYDALNRPVAITNGGEGTTRFAYDEVTGMLVQVVDAAGVVTRVGGYREANGEDVAGDADAGSTILSGLSLPSDLVTELETVRSIDGQTAYSRSFRYDGLERLEKSWDGLGNDDEDMPARTVQYWFASSPILAGSTGSLGAVQTVDLVQVASGEAATEAITRTKAALMTATGDKLAEASLIPEGWRLPSVVYLDRGDGRRTGYGGGMLGDTDAFPPGLEGLTGNLAELGHSLLSGMNVETDSERTLQEGVVYRDETSVTVGVDTWTEVLEVFADEGNSYTRKQSFDAWGRVASRTDESGNATMYQYDAMDRLVAVFMPGDEPEQPAATRTFDSYGRLWRVTRAGVGAIQYSYLPDGLVQGKEYYDATGSLDRAVVYERDSAARVVAEHWTSGNDERTVDYDYDGVGGEVVDGQLGFLSRVTVGDYSRTTLYNPDGSVQSQTVQLGSWRVVEEIPTYNEDGSIDSVSRTVADGEGATLSSLSKVYRYDLFGRLHAVDLYDGTGTATELYSVEFDSEGRLDAATFFRDAWTGPTAPSMVPIYDNTTRKVRGYAQDGGDWAFEYQWNYSERGLVASESIAFDATVLRTYGYDDRGFLEESTAGSVESSYQYGPDGLPSFAKDILGARTFEKVGSKRLLGNRVYSYDARGRVVRRDIASSDVSSCLAASSVGGQEGSVAGEGGIGDIPDDLPDTCGPVERTEFAYNARGLLGSASKGEAAWRFIYDEEGNRVAKISVGQDGIDTWVAGYVFGGFLRGNGLVEPLRLNGRVVGLLNDGAFVPVPLDARGTVVGENNAPLTGLSAYGVRDRLHSLSEVLDYVGQGRDQHLDLIRFGVRDLDPYLTMWLTADPLFLEEPERCIESPVECNIYSYSLNNPVNFTDSTGMYVDMMLRIVEGPPAPCAGQFNTMEEAKAARGQAAQRSLLDPFDLLGPLRGLAVGFGRLVMGVGKGVARRAVESAAKAAAAKAAKEAAEAAGEQISKGAQLAAKSGDKIGQQIARWRSIGGKGGPKEFLEYAGRLADDAVAAGQSVTGTVGSGAQALKNATIYRRGREFLVVQNDKVMSYVPEAASGGIVDEFLRLGGRL